MRSFCTALVVQTLAFAVTTSLAGAAFAQSDDDRATARAAATGGAKALEEGRFEDAINLFRRAESLIHAPPHLLYIARAQAKQGKLVSAQETYLKVTRETLGPDAPKAFTDAQAEAAAELGKLEPRIPTLRVDVEGAGSEDVTLTIDGVAAPSAMIGLARPIDPGKHQLQAKTASAASDVVSVELPEGGPQSIKIALRNGAKAGGRVDADSSNAGNADNRGAKTSSNVPAYVALGVGTVGVVLGTVFVAQNRSKRGQANDLCPNGACPASRRDDITAFDDAANSAATRAWISYGVGVVGLGAGAVLLLLNRDSGHDSTSSGSARVHLTPQVGIGSAGLAGTF
jgi:hypothetical protein